MKITGIEVLGFRSIKQLVVLNLPDEPALIHLKGDNRDEPRLGGNGAGKTSLWEAVCWCLYGKTASGLKGPDVASWHGGQGVYVLIHVNGHKVLRTWGTSNMLQLDRVDCAQADIDSVIGLSYESFLKAHYHGQHQPSFLDLGATAKTDLLAEVLELDRWADYSRRAAARLEAATTVLNGLAVRLAAYKAGFDTLDLQDLLQRSDAWEVDAKRRAEGILDALENARRLLRDLPDANDSRAAKLRRHLAECTELVEGAGQAAREADRALSAAEVAVRAAGPVLGSTCTVCLQPINHTYRDAMARSRKDAERAADSARGRLSECEVELKDAKALKATIAADLEAELEELAIARRRVDRAQRDVQDLKAQYDQARGQINPFTAQIEKAQERRRALRLSIDRTEASVHLYEKHVADLKAWVQRFKDIRLFLVTEALTQLEVEANSALVDLGLVGWKITFAPDTETKAGTIKRGFTTMIESPSNPKPVPWTVWSGGEAQRLRIAADWGLANLITTYTGCVSFVEVWDEPTMGLSVEGIDDMVRAFKERAMSRGKQVWVIDHHMLSAGQFDAVYTAIKHNGTTTIDAGI